MALRVLHLLLEPRIGGPQMRILGVSEYLKRLLPADVPGIDPIETAVILPEGDAPFAALLEQAGFPVYRTRLSRLRASLSPRIWQELLENSGPGLEDVVRIGRETHADVLHIHGLYQPQGVLAARRLDIPLVWHLNDLLLPRPLVRRVAPWVVLLSAGVITVSQAVRSYLFEGLPTQGKVVTVYDPPVRTEAVTRAAHAGLPEAQPDDSAGQHWLCSSAAGARVLTVGNLYQVKGHLTLVRAAAFVPPPVQLALVGAPLSTQPQVAADIHEARARLGLEQRFWLAGWRDDIQGLLDAADLYVHPSLSEACPLAVLEAMACGKAVVATRVGGVPELVEHGKTGLLVPPGQPVALAAAIRALLEDPERRRALGEAGRQRVHARFSLLRCAVGHAAVYDAVTHGRLPEPAAAERMTAARG